MEEAIAKIRFYFRIVARLREPDCKKVCASMYALHVSAARVLPVCSQYMPGGTDRRLLQCVCVFCLFGVAKLQIPLPSHASLRPQRCGASTRHWNDNIVIR